MISAGDDLILQTGLDLGPLSHGLEEGVRELNAFMRRLESMQPDLRQFAVVGTRAGADLASGIDRGVLAGLQGIEADVQRVIGGVIDEAQAEREAQRAARSMARALNQELGSRVVTIAMARRIIGDLEEAGARAGERMRRAVEAQMASLDVSRSNAAAAFRGLSEGASQATASIRPLATSTQRFTGDAQRMANAAVQVAFGLEGLARGGSAAEAGLRVALRSVAALAAGFGPQGLIVSGVAASTAAIIDLFSKTRDEMEETRRSFEENLRRMIESADQMGLQKELRTLLEGSPAAPRSALGDFAEGSLNDFRAQIRAIEKEIDIASRNVGGALVLGPLRNQLEQLRADSREAEAQAARITEALLNPPQLPRAATGLPTVTVTAKLDDTDARTAMERMRDEVEQTLAAFRAADALGFPLGDIFRDATRQAERLDGILARHAGSLDASRVAAMEMASALAPVLEAMGRQEKLELIDADTRRLIESLQRGEVTLSLPTISLSAPVGVDLYERSLQAARQAVADLAEAQRLLDFQRGIGNQGGAAEAARALEERAQAARDMMRQLSETIRTSPLLTDEQRSALLLRLADDFKAASGAAKQLDDDTAGIGRALATLTAGARGALQVADSLGAIDDQSRRTIDGVLGIVDALQTLKSAQAEGGAGLLGTISGALGLIGAAANIVSALTGPSAAQQEIVAALRSNEEELARVRAELAGLDLTPLGLLGTSSAIDRLGGNRGAATVLGGISLFRNIDEARRQMDAELRAVGSSFAEVAAAAESVGIRLFDSSGKLIPDAIAQLQHAIDLAAEAATRFGDNLDDEVARRNARAAIFDVEGPQQALDDALAMLTEFSPLAEQFFGGISTTTEQGREALEQAIRDYFEAIEAGTLPAELIGLSLEDLIPILLDADSALDDLAEQAAEAASALNDINIPAGFRRSALEFASTMEEMATTLPELPANIEPIPLDDLGLAVDRLSGTLDTGTRRLADVLADMIPLARVREDDLAGGGQWRALPAARTGGARDGAASVTMHLYEGAIAISGTGKTADQLFQEITEAARRAALQSGGSAALPYTKIP